MKMIKQFVQFFIAAAVSCAVVSCSGGTDSGGDLVLKASVAQIAADGLESVVFTVVDGTEDVTSGAKIYKGTAALESNTFTSTEIGEYKFTAKYNNNFSNELVVKVVPESSFKKKALLAVWTSTNCIHCPKMANQLKNNWLSARQGQIVVLYYHMMIGADDDDPFVVKDENGSVVFEGDMASWSDCIGGAPKAKLDAEYDVNYLHDASRFDLVLKRTPNTGIAIESGVNGNKLHVKVKTKADADYPYEPGLAIWLTEDGLASPQASVDGEILYDYVHNYVVRASLCPNYIGITIPEEYRKAGKEYVYKTDYEIPAGFVTKNLRLVAYVYQNVPKTVSYSQHQIDNAQEVKVGESVGYELNN